MAAGVIKTGCNVMWGGKFCAVTIMGMNDYIQIALPPDYVPRPGLAFNPDTGYREHTWVHVGDVIYMDDGISHRF